jgi:hypothetical protein
MIRCTNIGGSTWEAQFWTTSPVLIEVYVFDTFASIGGSNFGLQVFNEQGVLVADAATPFMRPMAYVSGTIGNKGPGWQESGMIGPYSQGYSVPAGKVATGAMLTAAYEGNFLWMSAWQHGGGQAVFSWNQSAHVGSYGADNNFVGFGSCLQWSGLIIDVEGI